MDQQENMPVLPTSDEIQPETQVEERRSEATKSEALSPTTQVEQQRSQSRIFNYVNLRKVVVTGVLVAISITMYLTNIGFIPVPNVTGSATIFHLPVVLGSILEGPFVGMITGLIFGLISFSRATIPIFQNPLIAILPRVLIGLTTWLVFLGLKRFNRDIAAAAAGVIGSLTNTVGVVGLAIVYGYMVPAAIPTLVPQVIVELIAAAIISVVIARVFSIIDARLVRAVDSKPRDQLPY